MYFSDTSLNIRDLQLSPWNEILVPTFTLDEEKDGYVARDQLLYAL